MEDDDFLDGCELDYNEYAIEDSDVDLTVLFPEGKDEELERQYRELFSG